MKGIYQYIDLNTNDVVYIGKDSNIGINRRCNDHMKPSTYDEQPFNKILQNNPDRYKYEVVCAYDDLSDNELNYLEIKEIMNHKFLYSERPKFNFSIGGDGQTGFRHSEETKKKLSDLNKGKKLNTETKIKISSATNTLGYYRVYKGKCNRCKKGYIFIYRYYDENGKRKIISAVNIKKLEKKVKAKNLEWRKIE